MTKLKDSPESKAKEYLLEKIGREKYEMWFSQLDLSFKKDKLQVLVPNSFMEGMLRRNYLAILEEAGSSVSGSEVGISFVVSREPSQQGSERRLKPANAKKPLKYPKARPVVVEDSPAGTGRYNLDDFIVGRKNKIAHRAARACAGSGSDLYNPLFFFGSYGLGKTHLLKAIVNETTRNNPSLKCKYISAEDFTNQFVNSTLRKDMNSFRKRFRGVDVLAIDDVHFLASKKGTQEEFLNTFNSIDHADKKIILASDSHPTMIEQFTESLVSRFVSGMVVKMEMPEFETRKKIVETKAAKMGLKISQEVIEYVAHNVTVSVRELEGAVKKLSAQQLLLEKKITLGSAQYLISDMVSRARSGPDAEGIIETTASFFNVSSSQLRSKAKAKTVSLARSVAMYLLREHSDMSYPEIGGCFGGKNHSTVIQACRKVQSLIESNATVDWKHRGLKRSEKIGSVLKQVSDSLNLQS
ncbi:Chromosomal replication initiator protein DnaA [Sedimentisphaera cyanobacteriorum]|uniref:Chromosomal replication initiator protein DnaA n=1 Tax=Sedimentisphaera cyanobacteriorum TaxID=1940790 RepID=A0A1Q2HLU3_9BACT|nr:chromosomal replication initiator protein DnaA [Sedimentisphaera cyanobacteriorum]AQQ08225.1 Chromosomal replication initiator protein DnaA [Sedimentisphaera cyanobacteriorum]